MPSNNEFEIIFWKVFNNQYLFRKIINTIKSTEWVYYTDYRKWRNENRMSFKNAVDFEWLIKNKQIELLRYKIMTNQHILFKKESIHLFFLMFPRLYSPDDSLSNKYKIEELEEILQLLLQFKRKEFEITDLTEIAIKCISIHLLAILVSKPYSIKVFPSTIEYIIKNQGSSMLSELINLNNDKDNVVENTIIFSDELKANALIYAGQNKNDAMGLKRFIIESSNFLFYSGPINKDSGLISNFGSTGRTDATAKCQLSKKEQEAHYIKNSKEKLINRQRKKTEGLESIMKFINIPYRTRNESYKYIKFFHIGIRYCNFKLLSDLESLNLVFEKTQLQANIKSENSIEDLCNLVNYFNSNKFKSFSPNLLDSFGENVITFLISKNISSIPSPLIELLNNPHLFLILINKSKYQLANYLILYTSFMSKEIEFNSNNNVNSNSIHHVGLNKLKHPHYLFNYDREIVFCDVENCGDFNDILSVLSTLVQRYNSGSNYSEFEISNFNRLFNYFWDSLISMEIIEIGELVRIYNSIIELSPTIIINHSLYHSFFYLQIRNSKFIKYLLSRPITIGNSFNDYICFSNTDYYEPDLTNSQRYEIPCFDFGDYLDVNLFTFNFIFKTIENGINFTNSFNKIMDILITSLSHSLLIKFCNEDNDFATRSLNKDLLFALSIRDKDLFFKQFNWISSKLENCCIVDYSFPMGISTTCPPSKCLLINDTNWINDLNVDEESNYINSFDIDSGTMEMACDVLDLQSIKRLIEFYNNYDLFHQEIFKSSCKVSRLDIISYLLDTYIIQFSSELWIDLIKSNKFELINMLFSNYQHLLKQPYQLKFYNLLDNHLSDIKNQDIFNTFQSNKESRIETIKLLLPIIIDQFDTQGIPFKQLESDATEIVKRKKLKLYQIYNQDSQLKSFISNLEMIDKFQKLDFFNISFVHGNVELCDLILKYYPNQRPTNTSITRVLELNKIHIINYYQQQQPSIFNQDQINQIKYEISNHLSYKHIK